MDNETEGGAETKGEADKEGMAHDFRGVLTSNQFAK